MKTYLLPLLLIFTCFCAETDKPSRDKIIIAHRGASGYLPEHTLEAVAAAHAMGSDYIEQDVVLTRDGHVIVLHDIYLEQITNVEKLFPDRCRADSHYYAIDFDLAEIKRLGVHRRGGEEIDTTKLPGHFPPGQRPFQVPTLEEEIVFIQNLNRESGKNTGIYVEMKKVHWHRENGVDLVQATWDILKTYGYRNPDDKGFIQCFESEPLKRLRTEFSCQLPLVQLIAMPKKGSIEDYAAMCTAAGIAKVAEYANGIGPNARLIVSEIDAGGKPVLSDLVQLAHRHQLVVHPYTFRANRLPKGIENFEKLVKLFFFQANVDGIFTDHPDQAVAILQKTGE